MKTQININNRGFSLLEAIIALFILMVGLLAVGLMQTGAIKANTNALSRSEGVILAQSIIDQLRGLDFTDNLLTDNGSLLDAGAAGTGTAPDATQADHNGSELFGSNPVVGANGISYTVFWNIDDNLNGDNTKTIRLFVYWNDQRFGLNRAIITSTVGGYL